MSSNCCYLPKEEVWEKKIATMIVKMEILEFTSKEAAAPLMSLAAPLWFLNFGKNPNSGIFFRNFEFFENFENYELKTSSIDATPIFIFCPPGCVKMPELQLPGRRLQQVRQCLRVQP